MSLPPALPTTAATAAGAAAAPSLRRRVSRLVLLLTLTWMVVASVSLGLWLRHETHELLDDGLVAASQALAAVMRSAGGFPSNTEAPGPAVPAEGLPFAWQVVDETGRVLGRSHNAPPERLAAPRAEGFVDAAGAWRVRVVELSPGRWLLVGQETSERLEATVELAGGTIAVALALSAFGLWWLRHRLADEMRPLADLHAVLSSYEPLRDGRPLRPPALQELAPVHAAVQQLGERLAAHAAAERAFSAHAAHALRTPLAGLEAQIAVAQREAPPALQPRLARLRTATGRLSKVVSALLALFRSSGEVARRPVHVPSVLARVPLEGLGLRFEGEAQAVPADEDLLAAALINLLDNSVRHGAQHVSVRVGADHVTLIDDGPGVGAERLAQLRQALAQEGAAPAAHEGAPTGLGLALADRVARAHGGRLELLAMAGRGFGVRLWLGAAGATGATGATGAPGLDATTEPPLASAQADGAEAAVPLAEACPPSDAGALSSRGP